MTLVNAAAKSFTARTVIGSTTYYLTVPTSNTFSMSTSSTTIRIATYSSDPDTVSHISTANRHIRRNGTSGLRSYANSTGAVAYFYKVVSDKVLSTISVSGTPTKTAYYAGESFDPSGLTITAKLR